MSRGVILPHPLDPFMLGYWMHGFNTVWGDEVDNLYIVINSPTERAVFDYAKKLIAHAKVTLLYYNHQLEHGDAIKSALGVITDKHVMLVEDDCFIFKHGLVSKCFESLEKGDAKIVGSKRNSCHPEISEKAKQMWGLNYEGEGDQGCNFWPNLFFCATDLLKKTDLNFGAKAWKRGEVIPTLDNHLVQNEVIYSDTFVNTSLQLRNMVDKSDILYIPQCHAHPSDLDHHANNRYLFDGFSPWIHIGSLSSGVHGLLTDHNNIPLAHRFNTTMAPRTHDNLITTDMERNEYARRIMWFDRFVTFDQSSDSILEYKQLYKDAIEKLLGTMQISKKYITRLHQIYSDLGLW